MSGDGAGPVDERGFGVTAAVGVAGPALELVAGVGGGGDPDPACYKALIQRRAGGDGTRLGRIDDQGELVLDVEVGGKREGRGRRGDSVRGGAGIAPVLEQVAGVGSALGGRGNGVGGAGSPGEGLGRSVGGAIDGNAESRRIGGEGDTGRAAEVSGDGAGPVDERGFGVAAAVGVAGPALELVAGVGGGGDPDPACYKALIQRRAGGDGTRLGRIDDQGELVLDVEVGGKREGRGRRGDSVRGGAGIAPVLEQVAGVGSALGGRGNGVGGAGSPGEGLGRSVGGAIDGNAESRRIGGEGDTGRAAEVSGDGAGPVDERGFGVAAAVGVAGPALELVAGVGGGGDPDPACYKALIQRRAGGDGTRLGRIDDQGELVLDVEVGGKREGRGRRGDSVRGGAGIAPVLEQVAGVGSALGGRGNGVGGAGSPGEGLGRSVGGAIDGNC